MATKRYVVHRDLLGDRQYKAGETRELEDHEAAPLLASGAVTPADEGEKGAKAERAAPLNKAEPATHETKRRVPRDDA